MSQWSGPQRVYDSGQFTVPKHLWTAINVPKGVGTVRVGLNPDDPRTLVVVPEELFDAWVNKGRARDAGLD